VVPIVALADGPEYGATATLADRQMDGLVRPRRRRSSAAACP